MKPENVQIALGELGEAIMKDPIPPSYVERAIDLLGDVDVLSPEDAYRLGRIEVAARMLFEVGSRKGLLHVTDEETGSDKLVGVFVPAAVFTRLGKALVRP